MGKAKKAKLKKHLANPYRKDKVPPSGKAAACAKPKQKPAPKPNSVPVQASQQSYVPFNADDRILLVGEGDFSFAHSLSTHHHCMALTATTFESRASLLEKYPQAVSTLASLAAASHTILFSTDATKLGQPHTPGGAALRKARFDAVVFNFPHVGGKSTDVNRQVRANQALVVGFLERAMGLLAEGGRVVLSIFEGQPYELWGVRNLARHVGLKVERSMKFDAMLYPGYSHARTLGNVEGGGGWKGEDRRARMFVFMKEGEVPREGGKKTVDSNEDDEEE